MRQKRFSLFQLLLAAALTAAVVLAAGALAVNHLLGGAGGRSLVEAWHLINTRFVGEYDQDAVIDGALEGMVNALGDRWSYTLTADELSAQNQRRTNQYVGIGITVNYANEEGLEILEVAAGGPAEEAGLLPGEVITAVDGTSLAGEARYEGADLIQGEEGTTVTLEVLGADGGTRTVEVTRASIETDPVESRMLEGDVGYVALSNFYDNSAQRLEEAVTALQEEGAPRPGVRHAGQRRRATSGSSPICWTSSCRRGPSSSAGIGRAMRRPPIPTPPAWSCPWRCWSTPTPTPPPSSSPPSSRSRGWR